MVLIIDCGSSKVPEIEKMVLKCGFKFKTIKMFDITPKENFSHLIISGAPILLTEIDYSRHLDWFSFVERFKKPILGICFGHQILGLLHNAKIFRCEEDRDWQKINIHSNIGILAGQGSVSKFTEDHCEAISLPENFKNIASSTICDNEAMQHVSKPRFGVQFHPETSEKNGELLFTNFLSLA